MIKRLPSAHAVKDAAMVVVDAATTVAYLVKVFVEDTRYERKNREYSLRVRREMRRRPEAPIEVVLADVARAA